MLKNLSRLECNIEGKIGHFYVDMDTPLNFVKEMLFQFQKYIGHVEDQLRLQNDSSKEDSSVDEEKCEVENLIE